MTHAAPGTARPVAHRPVPRGGAAVRPVGQRASGAGAPTRNSGVLVAT